MAQHLTVAIGAAFWAFLYNPADDTLPRILAATGLPHQGRVLLWNEHWSAGGHDFTVRGIHVDLPPLLLHEANRRGAPLVFPTGTRRWELACFQDDPTTSHWRPTRLIQLASSEQFGLVAQQWIEKLQWETILKGELL